jgi:methionyl-tRNA formyltransferase
MRLTFMGTPEAAVPALRRCLADGHEVVAVWTQPDRPTGRGKRVAMPGVKEVALECGITVQQPVSLKTPEAGALFAAGAPDFGVVVAYGRILPREFLRVPRLGCINLHFSLLPLYRGAVPVNWAIVNGQTKTGVTTMMMDQGLDTGPILLHRETPIGKNDAAPELMRRLATIGADLLSETLVRLSQITPSPQDPHNATFAPMLKKEDGLIDWMADAFAIERGIRGFQPWPNAYTHYRFQNLIIWRGIPKAGEPNQALAGEISAAHGDELIVRCGENSELVLLEVQWEGKQRMGVRDFLNGTSLRVGERLG